METDGYLVLRKRLGEEAVAAGRAGFLPGGRVHYPTMEAFVDGHMLAATAGLNGGRDRMVCCKYRASDADNSKDAGGFHRDLQNHAPVPAPPPPIFTVLCYLDEAEMEVIPGTHRTPVIPVGDLASALSRRRTLRLEPGDMLVFHSTLAHRGRFSGPRRPHRRLVQLFDCHLPRDVALADAILHVPCEPHCDRRFAGALSAAHRLPGTSEAVNLVAYVNDSSGYGVGGRELAATLRRHGCTSFSTESNTARLAPRHRGGEGPGNVYVLRRPLKDLPPEERSEYLRHAYRMGTAVATVIALIGALATAGAVVLVARLHTRMKSGRAASGGASRNRST